MEIDKYVNVLVNQTFLDPPQKMQPKFVAKHVMDCQSCHSHKISKFPDFSLIYLDFSLTTQTIKI